MHVAPLHKAFDTPVALTAFSPATVVWTDLDGVEHQCAANHALPSTDLLTAAIRAPQTRRSSTRSDTDEGGLASALGGDHYLADAVLVADRDPDVTDFAVRPAELRWYHLPSDPPFVVPMLQRTRSTHGFRVVDTERTRSSRASLIKAACREIGWEYAVFNRPDPEVMANLRDLSVDRHWWVAAGCDVQLDHVIDLCKHPRSIRSLCRAVCPEDPDRARALVNYALWHEFIVADLAHPLGEFTEVIARSAR